MSANSRPSQLKITDLRTATVGWGGWRFTLIRLDTNQGLSGYGEVRDGEAWLVGLHVPEYTEGNRSNHEPDRARKLLLHRKEIDRLSSAVAEKGFTLVPTRLYFKGGRVKVELALARGKELRDKRRDVAARDARREIERELKSLRR